MNSEKRIRILRDDFNDLSPEAIAKKDTRFDAAWRHLYARLSVMKTRDEEFRISWGSDVWKALVVLHRASPNECMEAVNAAVGAAALSDAPIMAAIEVLMSYTDDAISRRSEGRDP